jgi:hypothetical protein
VAINNSNNKNEVYLAPNTQYTCNVNSLGTEDPSSGVVKMCKIGSNIVAYEGDSFIASTSPTATTSCIPYFLITDIGGVDKLSNTFT